MQNMRVLSDYTHMAYPQVMELFSGRAGFLLARSQREKLLFGKAELGRLIVSSFIYAEVVCEFRRKGYVGCAAKAAAEEAERKGAGKIHEKLQSITDLRNRLEVAGSKLESVFPSSNEDARKVLRAFKQGKPM